MADCEHDNFSMQADIVRLTSKEGGPVTGYSAEITLKCTDCDEPFEFMGLPVGSLANEPACNVDGTEARLPVRPVSAPDGFGKNLPGFTVRML